MRNKLDEVFEKVRRQLFPEWDPKREWRVIHDPGANAAGYCRPARRTITIRSIDEHDVVLQEQIVHEICHAITLGGHEEPWQSQMLAAAQRARHLGDEDLAAALERDVEILRDSYRQDSRSPAQLILDRIEEMLQDDSSASWPKIREDIAREFGCESNEVLEICPEALETYEGAKRRVALITPLAD